MVHKQGSAPIWSDRQTKLAGVVRIRVRPREHEPVRRRLEDGEPRKIVVPRRFEHIDRSRARNFDGQIRASVGLEPDPRDREVVVWAPGRDDDRRRCGQRRERQLASDRNKRRATTAAADAPVLNAGSTAAAEQSCAAATSLSRLRAPSGDPTGASEPERAVATTTGEKRIAAPGATGDLVSGGAADRAAR
jgi:hypothetical protein